MSGRTGIPSMLLSSWLLFVLVGLTVAMVAVEAACEVVRRRRRRRGRRTLRGARLAFERLGAAVLIVGFSLLTVADGFNRHFSYIPTWSALFGNISPDLVRNPTAAATEVKAGDPVPTHGQVQQVQVAGDASGTEARDTYVYLPPAYFDGAHPDRRFPVLYLLHGSPGTSVDWLRGGYVDRTMDELARTGQIEPFIVVLPDVNGGYRRDVECEDIPGGPQAQTYLAKDVPTWIDAHYRTVADRTARAVGGLSTGGYCGINLTFRHQDVFSAAISHSGYGRPDVNRYTGDLFGGDRSLQLANTPNAYLPTIEVHPPLGVYLDAGSADGDSRKASTDLYDMLQRRGVSTTLNIVTGESHDFVAFRQNLSLSLPWVSRWFTEHPTASGATEVETPDTSYLPPPSATDIAPRPLCPTPEAAAALAAPAGPRPSGSAAAASTTGGRASRAGRRVIDTKRTPTAPASGGCPGSVLVREAAKRATGSIHLP